MSRSIPDQDVLRKALAEAIHSAYTTERQLFEERAHERSVLFHIGRRLAADVETWDGGWVVDLEYNRQHLDSTLAYEPKRVLFSGELDHGDGEPQTVFPDLIVHKRSGATRDHNLIVLEAKHAPVRSHRDYSYDYRKLRAFLKHFHYCYAVFLEFPCSGAKPRWQWISEPGLDHYQRPQEFF